jgi:hypothetical protein
MAAVALASAPAYAHSYHVYVSTPLSPPAGFEWIIPISWVVLVGLNAELAWLLTRQWRSVALAALGTLVGGCTFLLIGRVYANATTGPPVGLGAPSPRRITGQVHFPLEADNGTGSFSVD